MKKIVVAVFAALLVFSGCAAGKSNPNKKVSGTFRGTAQGMRAPIVVDVTVEKGEIKSVTVVQNEDSPVISDVAVNSVPQRICAQQNIEVDKVSGATITSFAIKTAVANALTEAGAVLDPYKKGSDAVKKTEKSAAESVDVAIVGGGLAGVSAAIEFARNSNLSVVVLEKEAYTGGSARVCGGGMWVVNSEMNKKVKLDSTKEELIAFYEKRSKGAPVNKKLIAAIYDKSAGVFDYFLEGGLPVSEERWYLAHPDSKLPVLESRHEGRYAWRVGESQMFDAVEKIAEGLGVKIRLNSKVTELITENGAVTGVKVEDETSKYTLNAKKVILASGGFSRNPELVKKYAPDYTKAIPFTCAGSTGDGFMLTEKLGVQIVGSGMMGIRGTTPFYGYYGRIGNLVFSAKTVVNKEGKDFGLKKAFYADGLKLILDQTDSMGISIYDETNAKLADRLEEAVAAGVAKKADTLEALAASYGINEAEFKRTAEANGIKNGPFYGLVTNPVLIGSIPGIKVDENCRVLNAEDKAIQNLFACGELIFGNVFSGAYASSGSGVGISAYTGAIAADAVIEELK
ncbi:FAD-dependent oxidoreductase [Treponema sp. HNW]|uniref:FAD-dependent oxidoreductase n=1 Tax=Treponema sp. HNW TaxID=3116654 RepID=UPI003D10597C